MKKNPRIKSVTPNVLFKLDYSRKFAKDVFSLNKEFVKRNLLFNGQTTPWGVNRVGGPLDGNGQTAWILDTGIDLDHSDLNVHTGNSVSFIANESADDQVGHGTHVAGIIAAQNNSQDVVGVAYGANVVAVKVCNSLPPSDPDSGCPVDAIIDGVDYVSNNAQPNDIVNMSLGGAANVPLDNAVINAANSGVRFTIAAGNDAIDANNTSPARVDHANVWTVSAFRQYNEFVQTFDWNTPNCNPTQSPNLGSNFGNPPIDYSAPGESIKSLWKNGGTSTTCGTSMAAPHIAGLLLAGPQGNGIIGDGTVSNDPDGNSDVIGVADFPLSVSTGGPSIINSGDMVHFAANVSNAEGSVSYQWYYKLSPGGSWVADGTSSSYQRTFYNNGSTDKEVFVKVEVNSAGETAEDTHNMTVTPCTRSGGNSVEPNVIIPC